MKKTMIALALVIALVASLGSTAIAASVVTAVSPTQAQISAVGSVYVNGVLLEADPSMGFFFLDSNGRTMAPLRLLAESLGYEVEWDNDFQKITIPDGPDGAVVMWIGLNTYVIGIETKTMDTMPVIIKESGRTVVPLRFMSEALGCTIETSGWGSKQGGQIWITAPLGVKNPDAENPSAGDKRPTSVDDLLDNPFIAKMVEADSGYNTGYAVTEAWMDGIRLMCGFESETGYFFAFSANGAITNAMPLLKEMVGAWVTSSADINEIFTLLEKRQQEVDVVNAKWTEEGSLINEMWYGSDSDKQKYDAELLEIRKKYKATNRDKDEVDIWQKTSGGVEFAFVWEGGFNIIIK